MSKKTQRELLISNRSRNVQKSHNVGGETNSSVFSFFLAFFLSFFLSLSLSCVCLSQLCARKSGVLKTFKASFHTAVQWGNLLLFGVKYRSNF